MGGLVQSTTPAWLSNGRVVALTRWGFKHTPGLPETRCRWWAFFLEAGQGPFPRFLVSFTYYEASLWDTRDDTIDTVEKRERRFVLTTTGRAGWLAWLAGVRRVALPPRMEGVE